MQIINTFLSDKVTQISVEFNLVRDEFDRLKRFFIEIESVKDCHESELVGNLSGNEINLIRESIKSFLIECGVECHALAWRKIEV